MSSTSMWKLSEEGERDAEDLFKCMPRASRLGDVRKTVSLMERLTRRGEAVALSAVASGLFSSTKAIHDAATLGVQALLPLVPSLELVRLNEMLGGSYRGYISDRWVAMTPSEVDAFLAKTQDVSVGGLLSFHRNGYIRQVAARFLGGVESGAELRFLLVRQNDWVAAVAHESQAIVRRKLTPSYVGHFAGETDLLFHLLQCERRDLQGIVADYVDLLVQPEHQELLLTTVDSAHGKLGRQFVGDLLERAGNHVPDVIQVGLASQDGVLRLRCLKLAADCLPPSACKDIADTLMADTFIPVRQEAYELKAKFSTAPESVWKNCLLDKNRGLRDTAAYYLSKMNCDVAAIYREKLTRLPNSLPALSGLAANGDATELEVLGSYLNSPLATRRAEAIRGIGRIGDKAEIVGLQKALLDESPRVVRAAHQQLESIAKSLDLEQLFGLIESCKHLAGKKAILRLLMESEHWSALRYAIRACGSADAGLAVFAKEVLGLAFSRNRVFTQPTPEQRTGIQQAVDEVRSSLDEPFARELNLYLSGFGISFGT